jgi:DNA-binding NarL/FixJ family response regulator
MTKIKLLVVDDHPMMREALVAALNEEADMEVIGEAADGNAAVRLAADGRPDVILMDLLMAGMGGLEAVAGICAANPHARILVVSSLEDEDNVRAAIEAGALGYFPKTAPRRYLLEAIRKVADGVPYLPSGLTAKLFKNLRETKAAQPAPPPSNTQVEPLTARQEVIMALLGQGRSDPEIAETLQIEEATVRSHVHRILQRLGLENRAQAVAYVMRHLKTD